MKRTQRKELFISKRADQYCANHDPLVMDLRTNRPDKRKARRKARKDYQQEAKTR